MVIAGMRIKSVILALIATFFPIFGWTTEMRIDGGREHRLFFGMEKGATTDFDRDIDKVSPPPPPFGFYCYFPLKDSTYEFLTALWGDVRASATDEKWTILLKRADKPVQVVFTKLPANGLLKINGIEVVSESLATTFAKSESLLTIEYFGGFAQSGSDTISFENKVSGWFSAGIYNSNKKEIRKFSNVYLRNCDQTLIWDGADNSGEKIEKGKYYFVLTSKDNPNAKLIEIPIEIKD
jgi:hypothetical protein